MVAEEKAQSRVRGGRGIGGGAAEEPDGNLVRWLPGAERGRKGRSERRLLSIHYY